MSVSLRESVGGESEAEHLLLWYRKMFELEFVDADGTILGLPPGEKPRFESGSILSAGERVQREVMENHVHFEFRIGHTPWERWRNNLTLACNLMDWWQLKLQIAFPGMEFVFFIYNEICAPCCSKNLAQEIQIHPTIRFWSLRNDPTGEYYRVYRVAEARIDMIEVCEDTLPSFAPASEVFTRTGEFRKAFVRRIAADLEDET